MCAEACKHASARCAGVVSGRPAPDRVGKRPQPFDAALGHGAPLTVFGDDYATPDGTCIRDYVHVLDLCDAHLAALEHLASHGESGPFNVGTGRGHSVNEVLETARNVRGVLIYGSDALAKL